MTSDNATQSQSDEMPLSIVLLLRASWPLSEDELRSAAEKGWRQSFDGKQDPMYFVSSAGKHAFVKAGKYVIKVLSIAEPYLGDPEEIAKQLPRREQRSAWNDHRAWIALDFWNLEVAKAEAYEMLARLSLPLLCNRCCGVFLPKEEIFMPNNGTAQEGLDLLLERALF